MNNPEHADAGYHNSVAHMVATQGLEHTIVDQLCGN